MVKRHTMSLLSRRSLLQVTGLSSVGAALAQLVRGQSSNPPAAHAVHSHAMGPVGRASTEIFDPSVYLRSWNFSHLPEPERSRFYRETRQPNGTMLREYQIFAVDREIE